MKYSLYFKYLRVKKSIFFSINDDTAVILDILDILDTARTTVTYSWFVVPFIPLFNQGPHSDSYQCDDFIFNDTAGGTIDKVRAALNSRQTSTNNGELPTLRPPSARKRKRNR